MTTTDLNSWTPSVSISFRGWVPRRAAAGPSVRPPAQRGAGGVGSTHSALNLGLRISVNGVGVYIGSVDLKFGTFTRKA